MLAADHQHPVAAEMSQKFSMLTHWPDSLLDSWGFLSALVLTTNTKWL